MEKSCIFMGEIPSGALFFMRLSNAFLLSKNGDFIEIVSNYDNLERDISAWAKLKGEKFISKTSLATADKSIKPSFAYLLQKCSLNNFEKFSPSLKIAPKNFGLAPNGAAIECASPKYDFSLNYKEEIFSSNLAKLYEDAKSSQWNATSDIPWSEIPQTSSALSFATAQIMTYLVENEFAALYVPARFLARVNPYFTQIPLLLSSIIGDEARHIESFIKRANATGLGVQYSSLTTQSSLYSLWREEDYFKSSFLLHIMGEGTFIDLLLFLENAASDEPTKKLLNLARRDEARHVAYGMNNVKNAITAHPGKIAVLKDAVFKRKTYLDSQNDESGLLLESMCVFAGGGDSAAEIARGYEMVVELKKKMEKNRTARLVECGIPEDLALDLSKAHTPNFM